MTKFRRKVSVVVKDTLPVVTAGIGITNLALNQKRIEQDREFHKHQEKATKELAKSLNQIVENTEVHDATKDLKKSVKKPYTEYKFGDGLFKFRRKKDKK